MTVSVLVPVLNEEDHIRDAIARMQAQRVEGEVEFLFVDGRSTDRTREILDELAGQDARIRVLDNPARDTTSALNVGLRGARGDFVARMDGHTLYPPDYLARAVERLSRGDVAWVCGPQIPQGRGRWSRRVAMALESPLGTAASGKWPSELPTEEAGTASLEYEVRPDDGIFTGVWRRETLQELGGWDEGWPVNQDCELLARVLDSGGQVVLLPELGAHYIPRDSLSGLVRQYFRYGKYRAKTAARHPQTLRRSHLLAPGLVVTLATAVLAPRAARRLAGAGLVVYGLGLAAAAARAAGPGRERDAAVLPAVHFAMHTSWGLGFLAGCARFGLPLEAIARTITPPPPAAGSAARRR